MPDPKEANEAASCAQPQALSSDAQSRVRSDLPCFRCGYNLRTLRFDGNCPECGTPIAETSCGDFLRYAPPQWVRGLAEGVSYLLGSVGVALGLTAFLLTNLFFDRYSNRDVTQIVLAIGFFVGLIFMSFGFLQLTHPDPRPRLVREGFSARRAFRWVWGLTFAAFLAGIAAWPFLLLAAPLAFVVLPAMFLHHLKTLLRRVPVPNLADAADLLIIAFVVFGFVLTVGLVGAWRVIGGPEFFICVFSSNFVVLAFLLFFLARVREAFRRAAHKAEAHAGAAALKKKGD